MNSNSTTAQVFPVLLFDGVCNLCNASVQWVLKRDKKNRFRFAALQSDTGRRLLEGVGFPNENLETVVLIDGDRFFTRSDAILEIARHLGGFWSLARACWIVPRPIRDTLYNWVARNRYRWFGQKEQCMLPKPEWQARFI